MVDLIHFQLLKCYKFYTIILRALSIPKGLFLLFHFHKEKRKTEKKKKESHTKGRRIVGSRFLRYFLYQWNNINIKNIAKPVGLDLEATLRACLSLLSFFVF